MLIPFPITFLTAPLATDVAARATENPYWSRTSRWMLGVSIVKGPVAGTVGAHRLLTIRRAREKSVGKLHAYGNPVAPDPAAANLALRQKRQVGAIPGTTEIALPTATAAVLGATGWASAELSYRHMQSVAGRRDWHTGEEKRYVP